MPIKRKRPADISAERVAPRLEGEEGIQKPLCR